MWDNSITLEVWKGEMRLNCFHRVLKLWLSHYFANLPVYFLRFQGFLGEKQNYLLPILFCLRSFDFEHHVTAHFYWCNEFLNILHIGQFCPVNLQQLISNLEFWHDNTSPSGRSVFFFVIWKMSACESKVSWNSFNLTCGNFERRLQTGLWSLQCSDWCAGVQ